MIHLLTQMVLTAAVLDSLATVMQIQIRRAMPSEAESLTSLAHAAKRHWNYPEKWIEHWKADLTISSEFIHNNDVYVALIDGVVAGCCALVISESLAELEHMWIDPQQMGQGVGRALFEHTIQRARQLGLSELELSADPNAEGFYNRMGAVRIGADRADMDGQPRVLPRMKVNIARERQG